jgi:hypothetical protein
MDPLTAMILEQLALGYFVQFSGGTVQRFFDNCFSRSPELKSQLLAAKTTQDFEKFFKDVLGTIYANAGDGAVTFDQGIVTAMRKIHFDHAKGTVTINGIIISAPKITTGGGPGATGQTSITDSELKTQGTSIKVGKGASIKITGNARIDQT